MQVLSGLSELLGSMSEPEPETLYRCSFTALKNHRGIQATESMLRMRCWPLDSQPLCFACPCIGNCCITACRTLVALGTVLHQDSMVRSIAVDLEMPQQVKQRQAGATGKVAEAAQEVLHVLQQ